MKYIVLGLLVYFSFSFVKVPSCGDGNVYANDKQTQYDRRFDSYEKIKSVPKYKHGDKKLNQLVLEKLVLSEVAKTQIFRLNYQFTITCEGEIKDVKQIGDPMVDDWTNIKEILEGTKGLWTPAKKEGKEVDCVYFTKVSVMRNNY